MKNEIVSFADCEWSIHLLLDIIDSFEKGFTVDELQSFDLNAYLYIISESRKILEQLEYRSE